MERKGNPSDGMMEVEKILPFPVCALSGSNQMNVVSTWFAEKFP